MKIDCDDRPGELAMNLTPMIDVVFLLLIFFMLATTFLDPEKEIDLDLPEASSSLAQEAHADELIGNVLRDGSLRLGGREVDASGLDEALQRAARRDPETAVTIRGDREARHEAIVGVMDACGRAGLSSLAVGTIEGG